MDELSNHMPLWWGLLLVVAGIGALGLAQVREWDSRDEFARVMGFALLLLAVGAFFLLGATR